MEASWNPGCGRDELLIESYICKGTNLNNDVLVKRKVRLYRTKFVTFHDWEKDPMNTKTWLLDSKCQVRPSLAKDMTIVRKFIRPPGTWSITAAFSSGLPSVDIYCFKVTWPSSWAASGYTTFNFGFENFSEAAHWHHLIMNECIGHLIFLREGRLLLDESLPIDPEPVVLDSTSDIVNVAVLGVGGGEGNNLCAETSETRREGNTKPISNGSTENNDNTDSTSDIILSDNTDNIPSSNLGEGIMGSKTITQDPTNLSNFHDGPPMTPDATPDLAPLPNAVPSSNPNVAKVPPAPLLPSAFALSLASPKYCCTTAVPHTPLHASRILSDGTTHHPYTAPAAEYGTAAEHPDHFEDAEDAMYDGNFYDDDDVDDGSDVDSLYDECMEDNDSDGSSAADDDDGSRNEEGAGEGGGNIWVPYRQSNGIAIYYHEDGSAAAKDSSSSSSSSSALSDLGGEYMVSTTIRGSPREVAKALIRGSTGAAGTRATTILGPASRVDVLQRRTPENPKEILRIVLTASGYAGIFCAPREVIVEQVVRQEDDGVVLVMFRSLDPKEADAAMRTAGFGLDGAVLLEETGTSGSEKKVAAEVKEGEEAKMKEEKEEGKEEEGGGKSKPKSEEKEKEKEKDEGEGEGEGEASKNSKSKSKTPAKRTGVKLPPPNSAAAKGLFGKGLFKRPVRGIVQGGYTIAGVRGGCKFGSRISDESLITCIVKMDFGGALSRRSIFRFASDLMGWTEKMLDRVLMSVTLLRDDVEQRRFTLRPFAFVSDVASRLDSINRRRCSSGGVYGRGLYDSAHEEKNTRQGGSLGGGGGGGYYYYNPQDASHQDPNDLYSKHGYGSYLSRQHQYQLQYQLQEEEKQQEEKQHEYQYQYQYQQQHQSQHQTHQMPQHHSQPHTASTTSSRYSTSFVKQASPSPPPSTQPLLSSHLPLPPPRHVSHVLRDDLSDAGSGFFTPRGAHNTGHSMTNSMNNAVPVPGATSRVPPPPPPPLLLLHSSPSLLRPTSSSRHPLLASGHYDSFAYPALSSPSAHGFISPYDAGGSSASASIFAAAGATSAAGGGSCTGSLSRDPSHRNTLNRNTLNRNTLSRDSSNRPIGRMRSARLSSAAEYNNSNISNSNISNRNLNNNNNSSVHNIRVNTAISFGLAVSDQIHGVDFNDSAVDSVADANAIVIAEKMMSYEEGDEAAALEGEKQAEKDKGGRSATPLVSGVVATTNMTATTVAAAVTTSTSTSTTTATATTTTMTSVLSLSADLPSPPSKSNFAAATAAASLIQVTAPPPPKFFDIQRVRNLSLLPPEKWAELHVAGQDSPFSVRGGTYLKDRRKEIAGAPQFVLAAIDLVDLGSNGPVYDIARFLPSVRQTTAAFSIVVNLIIPGTPMLSLACVFGSDKHPGQLGTPPSDPMESGSHDWSPFDFVLHKFVHGSDAERDKMLKLIPHIAEGSWMIRQSVGAVPVIIGSKLKTAYTLTDSYLEVDVDVSANSVANYVTGMVRGATKSLVIDLAFVLEGGALWELPESLLGSLRLKRIDCGAAKKLKMDLDD